MTIRIPRLRQIKLVRISTRTVIALTLAAVITLEAGVFTSEYFAAARYLKAHDPRNNGNLSGTLVFARPKVYRCNQQARPEQLIEHLTRIGFRSSELGEPGTFWLSADAIHSDLQLAGGTPALPGRTLLIRSRLPEIPSCALTFEGERIAAISVDSHPVDQVEVEPETLIALMHMMRDDRARPMNVRRIVLAPSDFVPSIIYDAVRSSEDKRFESSNGIDELGMARSLFKWTSSGFHSTASGSGITQQLMKNVVLKDSDKTFSRKSAELFLSIAATRMMTKQEIFTAYANNVYLGHVENGPTLLGFEAAAQEFFGTSVRDVSISRAAELSAILDRPEVYLRAAHNNDYSLILARRERVLNLMRQNFPDRYSAEAIEQAKTEPVDFVFTSERESEGSLDPISKPFENLAAIELTEALGRDFAAGNVHIFTTIDPELQLAASKAVNDELLRLDPMIARVRRSLPANQRGDEPIQAALVAMDAQTGEILAMANGRNSEFNYATARRSPGSAIKPFVYLPAIDHGWHAGEPFNEATIIDPQNDKVDNYRPTSHVGAPGTARALLARSDNGAAVIAAHDAGLASVREFILKATGAYSDELTGMLAIGGSAGSETTPLALCEGYSIFANAGARVSHTPFSSIYRDGARINLPRPSPIRLVDPAPAYVLTQMMRSVLKPGGTASGALSLAGLPGDSQIFAKTGTGQTADLLFVSFSKKLIVVTWVGMPHNKPVLKLEQGFQGATTAMPIWASFIRNGVKLHRSDLLEGEIEMPANVRLLKTDSQRGCVTDGPGVEAFFVTGREPRRCAE
jgi:membrane peptidoglycan carboxypeptidase